MAIIPASLAAVNGVSVKNQQFAVSAQVLPQKNVFIGTFDEATFAALEKNKPFRAFSAAEVGALTGFGFMLHRLVRAAERAGIVEMWIIPQAEGGSDPDQAVGEVDFTASADVRAGEIAGYIAGDRVPITTAAGDSADDIGTAFAAEINDDDDLPVTAVNLAGVVTLTSKSGGTWGNYISIAFSLIEGEELPTGVSAVVTDMAGGVGIPDIQDALDALGTGDAQNEKRFTNLIHGYGADTTTLNAISTYNGIGNEFVGNYKKEIARPFRSLVGDVTPLAAGLAAALAFADLRRNDRTNGKICAPGSYNHPQEIAAQAIGVMAVINSTRAEEGYINKNLDGVFVGEMADRWTNDYETGRDPAVRGGLSTTFAKNGVLTLQNLITFYRPASVAPESNGYRAMRNISIIQNMLYNYWLNFEGSKWQGISIVENVTEVSDVNSRLKARDTDSVIDDLVAIADVFAGKAWLYNSDYPKANLTVTLRAGLTGFDIIFPVILSGEGGIYNTTITFDTSIAVLLTGGA